MSFVFGYPSPNLASPNTALFVGVCSFFACLALVVVFGKHPTTTRVCDQRPCQIRRCNHQEHNLFDSDECFEWQEFSGTCEDNCRDVEGQPNEVAK